MFWQTFGMKEIFLLTVLIVKTSTLITNGTGEKCFEEICGYGTYCYKRTYCRCALGFKSKATTTGGTQFCSEFCEKDTDCPTGYTCHIKGQQVFRCNCDIGYIRSSLGQCIGTSTTTGPPKTLYISTKDVMESNENDTRITGNSGKTSQDSPPSTEHVVSIVFNCLLAAVVIILLVVLLRERLSIRQTLNITAGLESHVKQDHKRDLTGLKVTSPVTQSSPPVGNRKDNTGEGDSVTPQASNYVNMPAYVDLESMATSDYVNTEPTESSKDYVDLDFCQHGEQGDYAKLQNA